MTTEAVAIQSGRLNQRTTGSTKPPSIATVKISRTSATKSANGARKSVENTRMSASARPNCGSAKACETSGRLAKYDAISRGFTRPVYVASASMEPMATSQCGRRQADGVSNTILSPPA